MSFIASVPDLANELEAPNTAARAVFVIDKAGVVQYSEQTPTPKDLPNFEAIKATLAKLK
jgi:peroxiredoxin